MTSGKAIVTGSLLASVVIGAAIVAAAVVWREAPQAVAGKAPVPEAAPAPAKDAPGRYQIVRIENGVSWRLDTATGELTACRMEGDRMLCARSTEATELPKLSAKELEEQRKAAERAELDRRGQRKEERTAVLDRFMSFFKWVIEQARNAGPGETAPPAPSPDDRDTPRTL